jgi:hypothetical protein
MIKTVKDIKSYEDILDYLSNWTTWHGDPYVYDFAGIVRVLGACLDNLRNRAGEAELEETGAYLEQEQKEFLTKLAKLASLPPEDDRE